MRLVSLIELVREKSEAHRMTLKEYLLEERSDFMEALNKLHIYVDNKATGAERLYPSAISFGAANLLLIRRSRGMNQTVAMHYLDKGQPLQHPSLPCIVVRRSPTHYDYFPVERCFYIAQ
jgi:hypothetical protein